MEVSLGVYINKDLEGKMERLRELMENRQERVKVLTGEDFNARTGREREWGRKGKKRWEREKGGGMRRLMRKGGKLCGFLGELGWSILNENVKGDEKNRCTQEEREDRSSTTCWEIKRQGRG